ncbi:ATP-binding protein [Xinfangfangia sp. D13-10-4-6]|uniref:ATP-binding protein n=1 Tax=Pseudogemmobacter hezensis TaxID=2737662 RepID=UPI001557F565|nr:ATP-binding protein [Pseudogemmobacter hezensis]NPD17031.1 ATP-binding protein [Pseudogemmobacter hezensis]
MNPLLSAGKMALPRAALAALLLLAPFGAAAETPSEAGPETQIETQGITLAPTDPDFQGGIWAQNLDDPTKPFVPGAKIRVQGWKFRPGQTVMFSQGLVPFLPEPLVADAEGNIAVTLTIPKDAPVGVYPVVLSTTNPAHASIIDFRISPELPLSGADKFTRLSEKLSPGLYQSAYSQASQALFVTSAAGYPPIAQSEILKLDPDSLAVTARATPPKAPDGGLFGVYGLGVDDVNGTIWVTNTRHDTVAVYAQNDLRLLKQFEPGLAAHPRAVVALDGIVYISLVGMPGLMRFDGKTLAQLPMLPILSANSRNPFSPASLHPDRESGRIFTVSLTTSEVAVIDAKAGKVERLIPVPGARSAIGVSYDPKAGQIFVAAQGSDELITLDEDSGAVLRRLPVGAGPLNVVFDPVTGLTWVANRGAHSVVAADDQGHIVANLDVAPQPNHLIHDGKGGVFVVNRGDDPSDPNADRITRLIKAD